MDRRREVKNTYDRIATHFDETRHHPWPEVASFIAALPDHVPPGEGDGPGEPDRRRGSSRLGLDVGVGNGRHAVELAGAVDRVIGLDVSRPLLETARRRLAGTETNADLVQGEASALPLAADTVDVALSIATIHHLPSRSLRRRSLAELARVLRPGGLGLVSAWSVTAERFEATSPTETTLEWTLPDGRTVPRYFYLYDRETFAADLAAVALEVRALECSSENWYATVTPKSDSRTRE